jgi:putative nucleotidyltransferase with HDIG domain
MVKSASELVTDIGGLVSLPEMYLHINRIVEDPNCTTADIAKAVSKDPSFTLRLLKIANSALYSFPSAIDTVSKAVSIIGTSQIRNLALSMSAARSFAGLPNELVSMQNFWRHSLLCALVARHLAKEARGCDPDALFTAGLLHDIGELVLFNRLPELSKEALLLVLDSMEALSVHEAEQQLMGLDHSDVGGELARQWKLPPLLEECIAHHHRIEEAKRYPRETALIHIANIVAQMAELDSLSLGDVPAINPLAWEATRLDEASIEPAVREAQAEVAEIEKLFLDI